jgi:hypothetical protein
MPQLMADSATRDFVADAFAHSKFKFKSAKRAVSSPHQPSAVFRQMIRG